MDARTPEELETLLEDAYLLEDASAAASLFEGSAVVVHGGRIIRGPDAVGRAIVGWPRYQPRPDRLLQTCDLAVAVGGRRVAVMRRGPDRVWRFSVLDVG